MQGELLWLIRGTNVGAITRILDRLRLHGLDTVEPMSHQFRSWGTTTESAGEWWATTPSELLGPWSEDPDGEVAFQLWQGVAGLLVTLSNRGDHCRLSLGFEGRTPDEAEGLCATFLWLALTEPESLGLVVDRTLPESHEAWATFLSDPTAPLPETADVAWLCDRTFRDPLFKVVTGSW